MLYLLLETTMQAGQIFLMKPSNDHLICFVVTFLLLVSGVVILCESVVDTENHV